MTQLFLGEAGRLVALRRSPEAVGDSRAERARAVRRALESLGPFYVKLGQMLATRPDVMSGTMMAEFENLHDQVSPRPFSEFEPVLEADLGASWRTRFQEISTEMPLGAASLAQVYKVTLCDGRPAVVKIQRPGVTAMMVEDMKLLRLIAKGIGRAAPDFNEVIDIDAMLEVLFDTMQPELDFTVEAQNMQRAARLAKGFERVEVPDVLHATPRVLVQTLAPGSSIREFRPGDLSEQERFESGRELMGYMYQAYFTDRFFHADPHPGNLFVSRDGIVTIIDWGMVGRLDRRMSMSLMLLLIAINRNDGLSGARAWIELGRVTPWGDVNGFIGDMTRLVPKISGKSLGEVNFGTTLTEALRLATKRGIQTNPMISVLGKSYANLDGSISNFVPEIEMTDVTSDHLGEVMLHLAKEETSKEQVSALAIETLLGGAVIRNWRSVASDVLGRELTVQTAGLERRHSRREDRADARAARIQRGLFALAGTALWLDHRRRTRG